MRSPRTPNQALRILLAEARWSGARLAREVNALGAAQGTPYRYDRTTVAHWLAGSRPRPPVPQLVALALSRRLDRRVRAEDTGLLAPGRPSPDGESTGEGDAVARLDRILHGTCRCGLVLADPYALPTAAGPHEPFPPIEPQPPDPATGPAAPAPAFAPAPASDPPGRIGMNQVASARELLTLFSRTDSTFGSGAVRVPLRQYLSTTLLPWLRCDMKPAVRRELFTVAAQLAYLCAFAHFDMNHHVAAQRLYLTSIQLAAEAGDPVGRALGLRGLSVQAHALGRFAEAQDLAENAVHIGVRYVPPHQQAFLYGQLAVARAAAGGSGAAGLLTSAERCLERSASGATSVGAFHQGSLALQQAVVARSAGDLNAAVRAFQLSRRYRPAEEWRSAALAAAELAETQLSAGHLDQACNTWQDFLDVYPHIHSARADDRLRALHAALRPHSAHPAAAAVLARARVAHSRTGQDHRNGAGEGGGGNGSGNGHAGTDR
ncbi:hypothetical protein [Streptomyces sp. AM6-12]|uniref:hypothetical protein n=1 Tax=Streptomyces sp. AM6-12 TaxID=3345149 RepID=UPI0037BC4B6E